MIVLIGTVLDTIFQDNNQNVGNIFNISHLLVKRKLGD